MFTIESKYTFPEKGPSSDNNDTMFQIGYEAEAIDAKQLNMLVEEYLKEIGITPKDNLGSNSYRVKRIKGPEFVSVGDHIQSLLIENKHNLKGGFTLTILDPADYSITINKKPYSPKGAFQVSRSVAEKGFSLTYAVKPENEKSGGGDIVPIYLIESTFTGQGPRVSGLFLGPAPTKYASTAIPGQD